MITFSRHKRSSQSEIMDDFNLQGEEMEALMTDLRCVNTLLGGTKITTNGIAILLKDHPKDTPVRIIDIGCGDGALLRECALWGRKNGFTLKLIGIDANENIIREGRLRSVEFDEIEYQVLNIFSDEIKALQADICLCTLFLHHFPNAAILKILKRLTSQSRIGLVVNDLQRSAYAFHLFKLFSAIFIKTKIAKHDGLVSVARGFQKKELEVIGTEIPEATHQIRWKWAFRYQWLLKKQHACQLK